MFSSKLVLLLAAAATVAPSVLGYAKYSPLIPNGEAMGKSLGHTDSDYTPFGSMFSKNGKTWAGVCKEKWPGQATLTVGAVLGDPCCKWTSGKPDFVLTAPNTAGTTCAASAPAAAPSAAPAGAAATPAVSSAAPAAAAATKNPAAQVAPGPASAPAPSTPQVPGKVQPANPAPGTGGIGPVPAPVPAAVPTPGKAGNATVPAAPGSGAAPAPTPASSKLPAGKATGPTKICK